MTPRRILYFVPDLPQMLVSLMETEDPPQGAVAQCRLEHCATAEDIRRMCAMMLLFADTYKKPQEPKTPHLMIVKN